MILEKIKNNNHFLILSYYIIIFFLYKYTEQITRPEYIMHSKIDDYIPFVKEMVVPYLFWYVYITIPLVYFGFNSKKDFYKLSIFMFAGMTICFMIYLIFPNGQDLRPVIVSNDVFSRVIKNIYLLDTPTNSAPSMHVVDSIAVHISIINCEKLKTKKWITVTSFIIMVAIIASTVMIKQHSILDVMYGIGLSLILYLCIYKVNLLQYFKIKKLVSQNQDY